MPITDQTEREFLGYGLTALGCSLGGFAAALSTTAFDHMIASANICGPGAGHCLACISALSCLTAALVAGSAGLSLLRPHRARTSPETGLWRKSDQGPCSGLSLGEREHR